MNYYDFSIQDFVQGCPLQISISGVEDSWKMILKYNRSWRKNQVRNSFKKLAE